MKHICRDVFDCELTSICVHRNIHNHDSISFDCCDYEFICVDSLMEYERSPFSGAIINKYAKSCIPIILVK